MKNKASKAITNDAADVLTSDESAVERVLTSVDHTATAVPEIRTTPSESGPPEPPRLSVTSVTFQMMQERYAAQRISFPRTMDRLFSISGQGAATDQIVQVESTGQWGGGRTGVCEGRQTIIRHRY